MVDKRKQGRKYYRPSQAAPQGDQPLRHYLNRELQNIMSAINCDSELNDERDEDCYCIELCDDLTIGDPVNGGCLEWTVSQSTVTLADFWVGTGGGGDFGGRMDRDTIVAVSNNTIYVQDGTSIEYTTNYGTNWTRTPYLDWITVDQYWSDNEKTDPAWGSAAWPNGAPNASFSLQAWKMRGDDIWACHYNGGGSTSSFIANETTKTVGRSGFGLNALAETNALKENFKGAGWVPVRGVYSFTFGPNGLTTLGQTADQSGGPYPWRTSMTTATDPDQINVTPDTNSVQLNTGVANSLRIELINDFYLWYGSWNANGPNTPENHYGMVHKDILTGSSGGNNYILPTEWNGSSWYPTGDAWTEQPALQDLTAASNGTAYIETVKQRPATWLQNGDAQRMFAGLNASDEGTLWSQTTGATKYDYSPLYHFANQHIFEVIPVGSKGAFISVEVYASDRTQVAFKISPDGVPATFSEAVTGVFTVEPNGNYPTMTVDYSVANAEFLITYYDLNGQIHIVTFADPFVCSLREQTGTVKTNGLKQNDLLEYIEADDVWCNTRRTKAVGNYVGGNTYLKGDEVFDGDDLSEARIDGVTSSPYVAPTGTPEYLFAGTMQNDAQLASQIYFGNRYTASTEPFYITGYRVNTVAGNQYRVFTVFSGQLTELITFTAPTTGWLEFTVAPWAINVGETFDVSVLATEPDQTPVDVIAQYDYTTPQNITPALSGDIVHGRGTPDTMNVSYTDDLGGDRTVLIKGLSIGDQISDGIITWSVQSNADLTTYAQLIVAPASTSVPNIKDFTFSTVTATPISVPNDPGYWATTPYNIQGLIGVDVPYTDVTPSTTAYGVDILTQPAYIPDPAEWYLKIIGSGSGGGATQALSINEKLWVQQSTTLLNTAKVTTTDNQWTEAQRLTIPIGTGHRIRVRSTAKRTDGFGFYYGEIVGLMYNESGTVGVQDDTTFEQSTNPGMGMRIVSDLGDAVFEVNGFAMQDWDWSAVGFHLEIE